MCVKIAIRFFTFWTAFNLRFFVIIKNYRFPHSTGCFEKITFFNDKKKVGGLVILKKDKNYMKTLCNMGKTDL